MSDKKDIIYIDDSFVREICNKLFIIIIIILIFCLIDINLSKRLVMIGSIVFMFAIMFLSMVTFSFSENKFFTLNSACYILMGSLKIIEVISDSKLLSGLGNNILDICNIINGLYVYIIIRYLKGICLNYEKTKKDRKWDYFILFVFFLSLILNLFFHNNYSIISRILVLFIFFRTILYSLEFTFLEDKKINYFFIVLISFCIASIFDFMELFLNHNKFLAMFTSEVFSFMAYAIIYLSLSYKLLNKPLESLFTNIHNKNEYLLKINDSINNKNEHLEKIQCNIKSRELIFKNIYKNMKLPIIIVRDNNRIFYANEKFKEISGVNNIKKIINSNLFKYIEIINIDKILEKKHNKKGYIGNVKIRNNEVIDRIFKINTMNTIQGDKILLFYDITEEEKLERLRKELEKRKVEEKIKNDFLSNISHDIKTPINVIYSAIQLENVFIKERKIEELKKYNNINKENILTIARLANNLIDSSKLSNNYLSPNMKLENIVELVEDSCGRLIDYIINKNLNFYFDTEEEEIFINCDREFMERIIINLISNSIKYTMNGEITVKIYLRGNKVAIEFKDTGQGIDDNLVHNVFNKYSIGKEKLREMNKNTGIGLYVVKNLMKLQKGTINLKSKKGVGTTITLEFFVEKINGDLNDVIV